MKSTEARPPEAVSPDRHRSAPENKSRPENTASGKTARPTASLLAEEEKPSLEADDGKAPSRSTQAESLTPAAERALGWLESQLGPRKPAPQGGEARLIDSYEDETRAGWIYDASLAAILFTALGKTEIARELLRGLEMLQDEEGAWFFAYDPDRIRRLAEKKYAGSMAWVVMAINFYEWETGHTTFAPMAHRGLTYLLRFREDDASSETYGAFSMGPAAPGIYALEGNLDCYSAFLFRSELDRNPRYLKIARDIREFIFEVQWSGTTMSHENRYFKVGHRDNTLFLDAQSWTVLNFWRKGDPRLQDALRTAEERLLVTSGEWEGRSEIVGFNESAISTVSEKVWAEGTESMVLAYRLLGQEKNARFYHTQTGRYQAPSGGIPYATRNSDGWPTVPAVASTAWFLFNELSIGRNPFDPEWNSSEFANH